ncbi:MAG: hypothetical protein Q7J32_03905 [Sphingomonadaceae bacterium]|nr:hypothetical protein [Sphingomonadaceae bacterium]
MTIEVSNPATGRLVIPGVPDGGCGLQRGADDRLTVGFRWARGPRRPEQAVGATVTLDGVAHRLASARRSQVSQGFYIAVLSPVSPAAG